MTTTNKKKKSQAQSAKRKVQSAECKVQSSESGDQSASIEAQIAELEAQIALLQTQSSKSKVQSGGDEKHSELCALNSALPRDVLPAPELGGVFASGPRSVTLHWSGVPGANGYQLRVGFDPTMTTFVHSLVIPFGGTGFTLSGLEPDTTYYVAIRANATAPDTNSNFSVAKAVMTPNASQPGMVGDLQNWLNDLQTGFQNASMVLPQLETTSLTTAERKRLLGSGVRRYGFIDKVSDTAADYPQFWPGSVHGTIDFNDAVKERLREIEALRNLIVWLRYVTRVVGDLLLLAGDDAFRMANTYYSSVRSAAGSNLPGAEQVYQLLRLFFRRRRTSEEPTEQEVMRDFRALMHGTKDGSITVRNESGKVVKGEKVVIDNTMPKPRGGVKIVERGEVTES